MARPRAIQGEVEKRLLEALASGLTIRLACQFAGIGEATWFEEVKRNPEFLEKATRARLKHLPVALDQIRNAGKDDFRAAKAWVEMVYRDDYGRRLEVTGAQGEAVKVEVADARERLFARLERLANKSAAQEPDAEPKSG